MPWRGPEGSTEGVCAVEGSKGKYEGGSEPWRVQREALRGGLCHGGSKGKHLGGV